MAQDPELRRHQEWLGYLQPVGVTISPAALIAAQAFANANVVREQQRFRSLLKEVGDKLCVRDFKELCCDLLGWATEDFTPGNSDELTVVLPEYGERLSPTYAVRDPDDKEKWLLLVQVLSNGVDLDRAETAVKDGWHASPQARLERLLREMPVPIGLITNGAAIRLVYAPRGESSGHLTFPVEAMSEVAGRLIFAAFLTLFHADRLFNLPADRRLPRILDESRKYQNQVSTALADQVLAALYELLHGFRSADWERNGQLLRPVMQAAPDEVYGGLLTTLMRLVFLLYAEERGLLPTDDRVYLDNYAVGKLYARLRDDHERHPDTMDQRYGAWAQLLTLFHLIHDGASHGSLALPPRHGKLFDPDAYPFLEGRPRGSTRVAGEPMIPPKVSDGVIYRVLENLLILDGERISYRALDVEQIGSVYEAMMGFTLGMVQGAAIALKPKHVVIELDEVLEIDGEKRAKYLKEFVECDVTGAAVDQLKKARSHDDLLVALERRISRYTPMPLQAGSLYLQPTEERRRSGSHYTPRSLTEPIVRTTLRPVLDDLGPNPKPEQILSLKVCDPAMGSGAFLVEACRLLADRLVAAWVAHKSTPKLPPGEEPVVHARRLVAQQCLYGVDKNPFAVDLAKLSLWLVTLAKDHPFTFLDHALRHGDSLVGLTREQIASFHWTPQKQSPLIRGQIDEAMKRATELRARILSLADSDDTDQKSRLLAEVSTAVERVRLTGDAVAAAYFGATKERDRLALLQRHALVVQAALGGGGTMAELRALADTLRTAARPVPPFHWELEFPEVFRGTGTGFHGIVGNPPFMGGRRISEVLGETYSSYLRSVNPETSGGADLVAFFFRRAFSLLREQGAFGLIATKTIGQGDTRAAGLCWICTHGGTIYSARRRIKWPSAAAAVVVSVVHVLKGSSKPPLELDGRKVPTITAYLFQGGGHSNPAVLRENAGKSFQGTLVLGMGFTFDDTDTKGVASPLAEMHRLIKKDPRNRELIHPYIGGFELSTSPTHAPHRYVINFGEMTEAEARRWPDLMRIVEDRVRPERSTKDAKKYPRMVHEWWKFWNPRVEVHAAIRGLSRVLVISRIGNAFAFAFLPANYVINDKVIIFPFDAYAPFSVLQSRVHEVWVRSFSSTLKDDLQYAPSDCFETFPLPEGYQKTAKLDLESPGRAYYEFRAELMVRNDEGLTKTYNRFHDPNERSPEIVKLRDLHAAIDRAVLDAYGWTDLKPTWDFILDYEEDEQEEGNSRRKPWRYRWPDDIRDDVLARLLALNKERAEREKLDGKLAESSSSPKSNKPGRRAKSSPEQKSLF